MQLIKYLLAILLLVQIENVYSQTQDLQFEHLTTAEGLTTNWMVYCPIAQDAQGFLWIGSDHALYKYDGYNFTAYINDENNKTSISNSSVISLFNDSKGRLWIGTASGLDLWKPGSESFERYYPNPDKMKVTFANAIYKIAEDKDGNLWLAGMDLEKFNPETKTFTHFFHNSSNPNSISSDTTNAVYVDKKNTIWVGTSNGLNKYNEKTNNFTRYEIPKPKLGNSADNSVSCIYEDLEGHLLLGSTDSKLYCFDREKGIIENLRDFKNNSLKIWAPNSIQKGETYFTGIVTAIYQSPSTKEYWISAGSAGINRFDSSSNFIRHYGNAKEGEHGLIGSSFPTIFEDKSNTLWIGTFDDGIYKAASSASNFLPESYGMSKLGTLTNHTILAVTEDAKENLWLGTTDGILYKYNIKSKKLIKYSGNSKGLGTGNISFVFEDSKNNIWVGTISGLSLYNPKSDSFTTYFIKSKKSRFNHFVTANEDSSGNLTFGIWMNPENYVRYYKCNYNEVSGKVTFKYDPDFYLKLTLKHNGGKVKELSQNNFSNYFAKFTIHAVVEDKNGMIWVSTSEGLIKYNPLNNKYKLFTTDDGLPVNTMGPILEDDDGNLWIGNSAGLLKVNPDNDSFVNFGKREGLTNNLFGEQKAAYKGRNGLLYFGGFNGLTVIDPKRFKANTIKPIVQITKMEIFGKTISITKNGILNKSITMTRSINLDYNQNDLTIEYVGLHYKNPKNNSYIYKLEPYETEWNMVGDVRTARYTNLSPGKYKFIVKASNSDGIWNEEGRTLSIVINPPPWETWWAYTLYALFAFGFLYSLRRYELNRRQEKENKRLLQLENERKTKELEQAKEIEKAYTELKSTQAQLIHSEKMASLGELTAGIAHEIKNPLNFVNNFSEVSRELLNEIKTGLQNKNEKEVADLIEDLNQNLEKINHHGKRADSIVKGMLLHSRGTSGEKTLTDINNLLDEYVNLAYHGMRAKDKEFNITIEKDYDKSLGKINVVPQDISRAFLNIINNGCYAAYDRKKKSGEDFSPIIKVSTKNLNDKVEIRIVDNGNGIPDKIKDKIFQPFFTTKPTGEGTGLGLSLSYDIVTKVHGGELKVETKEEEGAEFIIIIPK
jgi:signal transduction histidine kinase/ligand-binding sensor domain-containing protein